MPKQTWQGRVNVARVREVLAGADVAPKGLRQCDGLLENPDSVEVEVPDVGEKRRARAALEGAGLTVIGLSASFVTVAAPGPRGPL